MAANTSGSTIRIRALMTPRTFDISFNAFDGTFPEWLVESLADCKEDVTIVLDVRAAFSFPQHLRCHLSAAAVSAACCNVKKPWLQSFPLLASPKRCGLPGVQGNKLMCPEHGFALERAAPAGRLDGLFCYQARASVEVTDATPMANITSLAFVAHHHLSGGAVFGIIVAVLLGVAGLAGEATSTSPPLLPSGRDIDMELSGLAPAFFIVIKGTDNETEFEITGWGPVLKSQPRCRRVTEWRGLQGWDTGATSGMAMRCAAQVDSRALTSTTAALPRGPCRAEGWARPTCTPPAAPSLGSAAAAWCAPLLCLLFSRQRGQCTGHARMEDLHSWHDAD